MIEVIALAALLQAAPGHAAASPHQPDPPPYVGEWVVEVIDNIKVMLESRVTIRIEAGSTSDVSSISGLAPCNSYRGSFTVGSDSRVRVGQLLKTMKACDPARMSEESDFFAVLNSVVGYDVRADDRLILRSGDGRTITARRAIPPSVP